ncbi:hypothetical protein B0T24DRAFT_208516 [Lasiosphaeria ovina]|uniref:Uncharacterized protein n=1 Tax=Lasiosphaeria ovina TaxID=92902 RepID=A0AAE0NA60_9PEZI|nr:hypothetical protein B0T24DRAFT_208516 [Lasiosphaeria ovina]
MARAQALPSEASNEPVKLADIGAWKTALLSGRPVLSHLNADTTWLVQLPRSPTGPEAAPGGRSHFNILIDPWLDGPQSDVASWFSTQWHVEPPFVRTIKELSDVLAQLEGDHDIMRPPSPAAVRERGALIDAAVVSHEFTDHCHRKTLEELPKSTPAFATDKAARLISTWKHFSCVVAIPGFSGTEPDWAEVLRDKTGSLPPWLGIGRVVSQGNALYYHSAVAIVFELPSASHGESRDAEAIIYSPHGIKATDLADFRGCLGNGIETLALLHGLDDVRIWMTSQLNLGALNGIEAARACGAKYWVATHDEAKRGAGFISWLLRRRSYTLHDAVETERAKTRAVPASLEKPASPDFAFVSLGSGDALVLLAG